jgi:hypothetical protein
MLAMGAPVGTAGGRIDERFRPSSSQSVFIFTNAVFA